MIKKSPAATALPEATGEGAPPRPNLNAFHRGTIQSVLTSCITVWCGNCHASDRRALQRTVPTAERVIGYTLRCIWKATSIMAASLFHSVDYCIDLVSFPFFSKHILFLCSCTLIQEDFVLLYSGVHCWVDNKTRLKFCPKIYII